MTNEEFSLLVGAVLDENENKVEEVLIEEISPGDKIIGSIRFGTKVRIFRLFELNHSHTRQTEQRAAPLVIFNDTSVPNNEPQKSYQLALADLQKKWGDKLPQQSLDFLKSQLEKELLDRKSYPKSSPENDLKTLLSILKLAPAEYEYLHRVLDPNAKTIERLTREAQVRSVAKKLYN
jgi:hypothetical protein